MHHRAAVGTRYHHRAALTGHPVGVELDAFNPRDALAGGAAGAVAVALGVIPWRRPAFAIAGFGVLTSLALVWRDLGEARLALATGVGAVAGSAALRWPAQLAVLGAMGAVTATVPAAVPIGARFALAAIVVLLGWGFEALGSRAPRWTTALVALAGVGGIWAAVPDTEAPVLVLGATAVAALACVPRPAEPLGPVPAAVWGEAAVPALWAAAWGAPGRPAALWGALAGAAVPITVGAIALVGWWRSPVDGRPAAWPGQLAAAVAAVQIGCALAGARWAARTAALAAGAWRASLVAVVGAAATILLLRRARQLK